MLLDIYIYIYIYTDRSHCLMAEACIELVCSGIVQFLLIFLAAFSTIPFLLTTVCKVKLEVLSCQNPAWHGDWVKIYLELVKEVNGITDFHLVLKLFHILYGCTLICTKLTVTLNVNKHSLVNKD